MSDLASDDVTATADPRAALAAWYLRPGLRRMMLVPISEVVALFLLLLVMRGAAEDPRANLEASTAATIARAPAPVAKTENAAIDYQLALSKLVPQLSFRPPARDLDYIGDPDVQECPAVKAYLAANVSTLQALQSGAAKTQCNFGLDYSLGLSMPTPYMGRIRECGRMLTFDARTKAHAGDHAGAAASLGTAYALARHTGSDSIAIARMLMLGIANVADDGLQHVLCCDPPSKLEDVTAYRHTLWGNRAARSLFLASIETERQMGLQVIDQLAVTGAPVALGGTSGTMMDNRFYAVLFYSSERNCFKAVMDEYAKPEAESAIHNDEQLAKFMAEHQTGPAVMTHMLTPVYSRMFLAASRNEESELLADTALAFLQFRAKYGRDAASLDALVPEFLPAVPTDPFHHHPLRLTTSAIDKRESQKKWVARLFGATPVIRIYTDSENGIDEHGIGNYDDVPDDRAFLLPPIGFKRAPIPANSQPDGGH